MTATWQLGYLNGPEAYSRYHRWDAHLIFVLKALVFLS